MEFEGNEDSLEAFDCLVKFLRRLHQDSNDEEAKKKLLKINGKQPETIKTISALPPSNTKPVRGKTHSALKEQNQKGSTNHKS